MYPDDALAIRVGGIRAIEGTVLGNASPGTGPTGNVATTAQPN
jgi:hypothetical protein